MKTLNNVNLQEKIKHYLEERKEGNISLEDPNKYFDFLEELVVKLKIKVKKPKDFHEFLKAYGRKRLFTKI